MAAMNIRGVLQAVLRDIDDDTLDYFSSMLEDADYQLDRDGLHESLAPFIESYGLADDSDSAAAICDEICDKLKSLGVKDDSSSVGKDGGSSGSGVIGSDGNSNSSNSDGPQLLEKAVRLNDVANSTLSEAEKAQVDKMWGFEAVRKRRNDVMLASEAASAKYERKAAKEQRKWLQELEQQLGVPLEDNSDDDNNNTDIDGMGTKVSGSSQISAMRLPDFSGKSRERDIHVHNFNISFGGRLLLDSADLRIVYGRRYGLVGRNGIGKTTLLKHMAAFDIEGFPTHHRILHVKQEVRSSSESVLQVVLSADMERSTLLRREQQLLQLQHQADETDSAALQLLVDESAAVSERMSIIGAHSAESRASSILAGLQFSEEMQHASTDSLSGGWRMRVALAGALLVEPDVLMLDEPTNHLDLEAVLWLEDYLKSYPHTVLLVSHDRAFLNAVSTDIVLFKKQKLLYYRGNYDQFEATSREERIVQQKQHEAQQVKVQHMQEFVDRFRFNAKKASLVQSRIKAIERENVVEAVEEEVQFAFGFQDAGQLGRPIIQIEGISFAYKAAAKPLFENVHLNVDQSSRVALVGPNGAGKSTLINLLMGKLQPSQGMVRVNPQLRIGLFTQHHMDSFDLSLSPVQNMLQRWPLAPEPELRSHLGKFEITGTDALKPMKFSSGGQKSRVAFAVLTFSKPHVVIMDEPTNHLDMGAIEALCSALKNFTGGVLVVSHDQHFITSVCNELWVIAGNNSSNNNSKGQVQRYEGSFQDYKTQVITQIRQQQQQRLRNSRATK